MTIQFYLKKISSLFFFVLLLFCAEISAYELSILTMFKDESKYLKEWVDYHLLVGVEHFWLYNDHSSDNWEEVLRPYIDNGTIDVIQWTEGTGFGCQAAIYRDGISRSIGKTKWLAVIDLDEFLIPMKDETVPETLNKYYKDASAVYINWRCFGTGKVTIPERGSLLYHLTACSFSYHPDNRVGKTIVKPESVQLETLWNPHHFELYPGSTYLDGNALPIPWKGNDFEFGHKYCDKLLRVNHYVLRDEFFFWNYRYKRTEDKNLLMEHYESFNLLKDKAIHRFVKKLHPELFK